MMLPSYTHDDGSKECPFCHSAHPSTVQYEDWWAPTECCHKCCLTCARPDRASGASYCPQCAEEESLAMQGRQVDDTGANHDNVL